MGSLTGLGSLFMMKFMKETKGKSQQEIQDMFLIKDKEEQVLKRNLIGSFR